VACRQVKNKPELIRLVRTGEGKIVFDRSGKIGGRGAYLCSETGCWEAALKSNHLEHSLRIGMTKDNREQLMKLGKEALEESTRG
jgi:predicted RNA-binding protein YlxR (DUF448 family)